MDRKKLCKKCKETNACLARRLFIKQLLFLSTQANFNLDKSHVIKKSQKHPKNISMSKGNEIKMTQSNPNKRKINYAVHRYFLMVQ
ncbi:hypothetical protein RFI_07500 [Reticulomyxa filosa]|uniref:Uncharacterized protein n=1 Tax=Reticulomyxa filosa TaxID=46433 RepID=X6NUZ3_RETFI|nr:hypothetical protein RFI_07500 [Reticulomyxa filosa]|eukprot:ETO29619.1 hypothetical protein RFI_07500 [Reticulomyxa filosa]